MTGSMYAAIAGLQTHMQKLNVIGNNIANINTYSYKSGRAVFQTSLYTSVSSGSNGTETVGGKNPSQIGYGVTMTSVDVNMGTGTFAYTGRATDCMIDGDGFFLVGSKDLCQNFSATDPQSYKSLTLTRMGDFEFKADGYLTDNMGNCVYGFMSTGIGPDGETPMVSDQLVPLRIPRIRYVNYNAADGAVSTLTGADLDTAIRNGTVVRTAEVAYATVEGAEGNYNGILRDATNAVGDDQDAAQEELPVATLEGVKIDGKTGKITATVKETGEIITIGFIAIGNVTNPNGVTQISNTYYKAEEGAGNLRITMIGGMQTQVYNAANADNYPAEGAAGEEAQVAPVDGIRYANGSTLAEGETAADLSEIISSGGTFLNTSGLEMSKTDLATEISEMITTQRGYQANTRIVTVTDTMLEELVNMKR